MVAGHATSTPCARAFRRSSPIALSVLVCILVLCIPQAQTQSCAPLTDGTCEDFTPVGTHIFVPGDPGFDINFLMSAANRLFNLINFSPIREPCRSLALQLICMTWLRPCQIVGNVSVPIPQQPCLDLCWTYYNTCAAGIARAGEPFGLGLYYPPPTQPPLNCSNPPIDQWAQNTTMWPNGNTRYFYQGANQTLSCNNQPPRFTNPVSQHCNEPLEKTRNARGTPFCAFKCPLPSLTESEYDSAKVMQGIMGWFSWVGSTILLVSLAINPTTRNFPRNMVLMTAAAANVAAGAIILPTMAGYDNTWCGGSDVLILPELEIITFTPIGLPDFVFVIDEAVLAVESSLCTFQGAVLQFGFLSATFWWTLIAFNMCLELYLGRVFSLEQGLWKWCRFGIYNVLGWGLAFLCMVIPASAGRIKFLPGATYCFVVQEDDNAWILTFWFLPVGIALVLGITLFVAALVRITFLLVNIKKHKELLILYIRISVFIVLFLFLFTVIFAYNIQIANNESEINSGYQDYYKCLIYGTRNCELSDSVSNYDLVMLKGWAISSLGILLFFTFFFSWDILLFWYLLIKGLGMICIQRKFSNIMAVGKMVASTSTTQRTLAEDELTEMDSTTTMPDDDVDGVTHSSEDDTNRGSDRGGASSSSED